MLIINILDWKKPQNKHPVWKLLRSIEIIKILKYICSNGQKYSCVNYSVF